MNTVLRPAVVMMALFTLITGLLYPLTVTLLGGTLFPFQANGSLVSWHGRIVGSILIAQPFSKPGHFWPRPSAVHYNAGSSGGSNLGPSSMVLRHRVEMRLRAEQAENPGAGPVPVGLLETSGSGLDPDISPAAALYQVPRVARARSVEPDELVALVRRCTRAPTFGFIGEPRVNVLELNLALNEHETCAEWARKYPTQ